MPAPLAEDAPGLPLGEPGVIPPPTGGVLIPVRFLRLAVPYNTGDVAGFPEEQVKKFEAAKIAERLESPAAAPAPDAGKPKPKPGKPKPPPDAAPEAAPAPAPEDTPDANNP